MRKLLALSILVSTALTGCGTGGSGGSGGSSNGSSTPAAQQYTFEFVQMVAVPAPDPACTIFDGLGQNSDSEYYAKVAKTPKVQVYKADGSFDKALTVSDNGTVSFTVNDVADGGYVSIVDSSGAGKPFYDVLTIQKALLGNYLIRINQEQGQAVCYKGGAGISTKKGFASIVPDGIISSQYEFKTTLSTVAKDSRQSVEIEAYNDEKVLAKAYDGSDLTGYEFVSQLLAQYESPTILSAVNETLSWTALSLDLINLDGLAIHLIKGNYIYPWYQAEFNKSNNTTTPFPYVPIENDWLYSAKGKSFNWNFVHIEAFTSSFDIELPVTLADVAAEISGSGSNFIFEAKGISSTRNLIQRSYYTQSNNSPLSTLSHTIYSVPNSDGEVIIPDLKLANLAALNPKSIAVSVLAKESMDAGFTASFMRSYQPIAPDAETFTMVEDAVSLVLTPAAQTEQRKAMQMSTYTLVER